MTHGVDTRMISMRKDSCHTARTLHTSSAFISDNDVSLFNHVLISYANVFFFLLRLPNTTETTPAAASCAFTDQCDFRTMSLIFILQLQFSPAACCTAVQISFDCSQMSKQLI